LTFPFVNQSITPFWKVVWHLEVRFGPSKDPP